MLLASLFMNLQLTVAVSWCNNCRPISARATNSYGGNCSSYLVAFRSCIIASTVCLSTFSNSSSYRVGGGLQYEDIKRSHVVIHPHYFNGIPWRVTVVNQIHMESWLKAVFELPHQTPSKGELYLSDCKWLHFHCHSCLFFYPTRPPLRFLAVSTNTYHIVLLRACVWGIHVCERMRKGGKTPSASRTCLMHTKKWAF